MARLCGQESPAARQHLHLADPARAFPAARRRDKDPVGGQGPQKRASRRRMQTLVRVVVDGDRGAGAKIGPGETLLFDVKLIEVK